MFSRERLIGMLFSGYMTMLYASLMALWIAYEVGSFLSSVSDQIGVAFK